MLSKEKKLPTERPWRATGRMFICQYCDTRFYRRASQIKRGITKTCGNRACISASMRGEGNPFWGKNHDPETSALIKQSKRARPVKDQMAPPKGYKHSPEARAAIGAATKRRWVENRDVMLAQNPPFYKPDNQLRYRRNFSSVQREMWLADKCAWCDATDELVLDHIIPVMCGGKAEKNNAQTLCQPCNRWKLKYVDRPLFLAGFRQPGGLEDKSLTTGMFDCPRSSVLGQSSDPQKMS